MRQEETHQSFDGADSALERAGRAAYSGFAVRVVARTTSTQELALAAARGGAAAGWCAVAEEQTAGRGRQGRRWSAPPGSALLVSMLVPALGGSGWPALAAGLAVADAVDAAVESRRLGLALKWPNDVLAGGGKLAGVLVEAPGVSRAAPLLALGVGINVTVGEFEPGVRGVSLHTLVHPDPPPRREALLAALLSAVRRHWEVLGAKGPPALAAAWLERAAGMGEAVVADTPQGRVVGTQRGLDSDGALLIETAHGVQRLVAADVHIRG